MASFLNKSRPPVFCPGCGHEIVVRALDKAFQNLGFEANRICMASDIGCSGLFDAFFDTHAFHGLHGRVLTYATAIKLCRPELHVVATMGDGGLGIGGAHLLAACRRNVNITLLVLNNFNFGMTGGQCSSTTPSEAEVASGFLNQLEKPLDLHAVAVAAGAPYMATVSGYRKDLHAVIEEAITFEGFSIVDIRGICPGRYTRRNKLTPVAIEQDLNQKGYCNGPIAGNIRQEYGLAYRQSASRQQTAKPPKSMETQFKAPEPGRQEVVLLGSAGQRVITAGELLGLAAISAGLSVTQKNDYDITVLRGPSISELILSPEKIDYTTITRPSAILVLAEEGVARRRDMFGQVDETTLVIQAAGIAIPDTRATLKTVDFSTLGLKAPDWSMASLAVMAGMRKVIDPAMLDAAIGHRFEGKVRDTAKALVDRVITTIV